MSLLWGHNILIKCVSLLLPYTESQTALQLVEAACNEFKIQWSMYSAKNKPLAIMPQELF